MSARRFIFVSFAVVLTDQFTKCLAMRYIPAIGSIPIIPGVFQLTLTTNTGAAFGLFRFATPYLAVVALLAMAAIVVCFARIRRTTNVALGTALALALGGATGNFIDRVIRRYVVDFLDAYVGSHHWPIFNFADASICIGVGVVMILFLSGRNLEAFANEGAQVER